MCGRRRGMCLAGRIVWIRDPLDAAAVPCGSIAPLLCQGLFVTSWDASARVLLVASMPDDRIMRLGGRNAGRWVCLRPHTRHHWAAAALPYRLS